MRKPLTGQLSIRILAVKDVDHAATGRFSRSPETFVAVKVEDNVVARTKASKTDKWEAEYHNIDVEKANEIEITVYDKPGDHPLPIGLLWIRISDIVEEMRRKKIEAEISSSGWVSADRMGNGGGGPPPQFNMNPQQSQFGSSPDNQGFGGARNNPMASANATIPAQPIDAWFALEPTGQIHLTVSFSKQAKNSRPFDLGLNRKGAIRQRKEAVHEMYGHKFVQQQFYNIMRCALCGEFLKYSAGMQCEDCKYTCHTKCYSSVVTKCISKSNAETDPEEEKINHRIPHRFEKFSNMSANWCCHCGYMLPFGKKNCRKCTGEGTIRLQFMHGLTLYRMRPHSPCPMCPSCTRLLRYVNGGSQCDPRRHKEPKASCSATVTYERTYIEARNWSIDSIFSDTYSGSPCIIWIRRSLPKS